MNARLRRLYADHQKIQDEFTGHDYVEVVALYGNPPEAYEVIYRVPGLRLDKATNRPMRVTEHRARIYLHQNYPREKPKCVMETEIFHPNFGPYICIDDYWAAGETIADIIIQIGQMIQYQNYNPKSPLDAVASRWAEQNRHLFPIGNVDLYQPELDIDLLDASTTKPAVQKHPAPTPQTGGDLDIELE